MKIIIIMLLALSCTSREYDDHILAKAPPIKDNKNFCFEKEINSVPVKILKKVDKSKCRFIQKIDTDYCHNFNSQDWPLKQLQSLAYKLKANSIFLPNGLNANKYERIEAWSYKCH